MSHHLLTLTLVLMGLFLAIGRARKLSFLAAGKQLWRSWLWLWLAAGSGSGLTVWDFSPEMSALLLSSVGLRLGRKEVLVRRGGEVLSLLSPPILSFLAAVVSSDTLGSPALSEVVVLDLRTGLLTMGTMLSGISLLSLAADDSLALSPSSPHLIVSRLARIDPGRETGAERREGGGRVLTVRRVVRVRRRMALFLVLSLSTAITLSHYSVVRLTILASQSSQGWQSFKQLSLARRIAI